MFDKEQLIDALDSVTWYNGLAEYILKWKKTPLLKTHDDFPNWLSPRVGFFYSWPAGGKEQLQMIWMICVVLFGDYGTSPRSGWIEKKDEFYQFLDDITRTWRESNEYDENFEPEEEEKDEEEGQEVRNRFKPKGIKISEKYGVNPTIPLCFWCGKDKNEVVLLGKLKDDAEAPKHTWINGDYEPCDKCREAMSRGIAVVQATEKPVVEIQQPYHGAYPTGNWFVTTEAGIRKLLDEEYAEKAIKQRMVFADIESYSAILDTIRKDLALQKEGMPHDDSSDDN